MQMLNNNWADKSFKIAKLQKIKKTKIDFLYTGLSLMINIASVAQWHLFKVKHQNYTLSAFFFFLEASLLKFNKHIQQIVRNKKLTV